MAIALALLLAGCFWSVLGLNNAPAVGSLSLTNSQLCNQSFADADGTGIYYYNPKLPQGYGAGAFDQVDGTTLPVSIAGTLVQGRNSSHRTEISLWFSSAGANYTDDLDLGFDACGLIAGPFSEEINARGARDNGSCYTMFDAACVSSLEANAQNYALNLTLLPVVANSLNASSLQYICTEISQKLNSNLPEACTKYFRDPSNPEATALFAATPLTGNNKGYNESCRINGTYSHIGTITAVNNSVSVYDELASAAALLQIVYMPVANAARTQFIQQSNSGLICGHINDFQEGSRVPAPLQSTPEQETGLSKGAIAGIVLGAVIGATCFSWLLWTLSQRRRRRAKEEYDRFKQGVKMNEAEGLSCQVLEAPDNSLSEAGPCGSHCRVHELHSQDCWTHELDGHDSQCHELDGQNFRPQELPVSGKH